MGLQLLAAPCVAKKTGDEPKKKGSRRSPEEMKADWKERVGVITVSDKIILEAAGPQHGEQYQEESIRDVHCKCCQFLGVPSPNSNPNPTPKPTPKP